MIYYNNEDFISIYFSEFSYFDIFNWSNKTYIY